MAKAPKIFLALTGTVPVLLAFTGDTTSLIYSLFILVYLFCPLVTPIISQRAIPGLLLFIFFATFFGLFSESLVWFGEYNANFRHTTGVNPEYFTHISNFFLFYLGIGIAWALILRLFRFSLWEIFLTHGLFGIIVEQQASIILGILTNPFLIIWLPYIFVTYASSVSIAYLLTGQKTGTEGKRVTWLKYIIAWVVLGAVMGVISTLTGTL